MLEAMRQNSRSAIIYILFGVLIAAFIISFGPGSQSSEPSGRTGGQFAARVAGHEISEKDFHFAWVASGAAGNPEQARLQRVKELILDELISRELMAEEAQRLGLLVSEDEVTQLLLSGKIMVTNRVRPIESWAMNKEGVLDYDRFRMVAQNHFGLNIKQLVEVQQRELLAHKMIELTRVATKVSPDEVKADFMDKGLQANLSYVRFSPSRYESEVNLTDTDIESYAAAHEDAIKKEYEQRKALYQKQDRTAHLRRILIEVPKDDKDDSDKVKAATEKLKSALSTINSGTRFVDVARTVSEDSATKFRGGDMGWRKAGFTGLGDELDKKVFAAKEGELLGPVRSEQGLELIKVEGFRQGDIALAAARTELSERLLREQKMKDLAQAAAKAAADKAKAGGTLEALFPKPTDAEQAKAGGDKRPRIEAEETGLFSRRGEVVQGIGASAELAKAAFHTLKPGESIGPVQVGEGFVVATLKERKEPDLTEWDKRKPEIIQEYTVTKWAEVLRSWTKARCVEVRDAGKIQVNPDILTYEGRGRTPLELPDHKYEPCASRL